METDFVAQHLNNKISRHSSDAILRFGDLLACSCSAASFKVRDRGTFVCTACGRFFALDSLVFVDSGLREVNNALESLDYDELHGVSVDAGMHYGKRWLEHIRLKIPLSEDLDILELGAGTGLLTIGLAANGGVRRLLVTDLSGKFLRSNSELVDSLLLARGSAMPNPPSICYLQCSIDDLPFKSESVNVVVANSVLHHIFDYELALRRIFRILRPGGIAFFSEPVIEGKAYIGYFASLIRAIDQRAPQPLFTNAEHALLSDLAILCTRSFWEIAAISKKDTADDKHLFGIADIRRIAKDIGWTEVDVVSYDPINDGLYAALEDSLRIMKIRVEPLDNYRFLFDCFQKQVIGELPHQVLTPHAFLIFKK